MITISYYWLPLHYNPIVIKVVVSHKKNCFSINNLHLPHFISFGFIGSNTFQQQLSTKSKKAMTSSLTIHD